ncbi:hypothetical protein B0H14DRAFT_3473372 [Mycena olivaceomarginata]|nr:hypothetical protein B0H14DRAFT_3473372 [Mycena olivaceomarginata]
MSADLCRLGSCIARAGDPSERSDYDAFVTCRISSPTFLYPKTIMTSKLNANT